jgi:hypothetical protein
MGRYVINNPSFEQYCATSWANEAARIASTGHKVPEQPGDGFLAGLAANKDLCISTWHVDGVYKVCGRPVELLTDPYYCPECKKARNTHLGITTITSEPQAQGETVPF